MNSSCPPHPTDDSRRIPGLQLLRENGWLTPHNSGPLCSSPRFSAVLRSFATPGTEMMLAARRMPATSEGQERGCGDRRRPAENGGERPQSWGAEEAVSTRERTSRNRPIISCAMRGAIMVHHASTPPGNASPRLSAVLRSSPQCSAAPFISFTCSLPRGLCGATFSLATEIPTAVRAEIAESGTRPPHLLFDC
jgi:hypothetical protein